jgi:hypothetical protein
MPKPNLVLLIVVGFVFCFTQLQAAQTEQNQKLKSKPLPQFEDYPVSRVSEHGPPASIYRARDISSANEYRRKAVEASKAGPNFAGNHAIVTSSCGFICVNLSVVNVRTGKVYHPPFGTVSDDCGKIYLDYRLNSRLLIVSGLIEEDEGKGECGTHYYLWKENHFVLLRESALKSKHDK